MSNTEQPVFRQPIPVRWGDLDAYGHVNNTVYFRFFEEARIQWLGSLALSADGDGEGPVIITTSATFRQELTYPGDVIIEVLTGKAGNTSLETIYRVRGSSDGELYAEGEAKIVWVSHDTGRPTPLPDTLRNLARS